MRRINEVLKEIDHFIDRTILEDFIARGWICPLRDKTDYYFEDVDMSRIRLVCELHVDMKFEVEAVDIILSLIDQLHASRSQLGEIVKAIENQPQNVQNAIFEFLKKDK